MTTRDAELARGAFEAWEEAPSGRAPASGVAVEWEVFCVMRFRDGLMVDLRNYFDRDTALAVADVDRSVAAR